MDHGDQGSPPGVDGRQRWFEALTLAVLDHVIASGERIDRAASGLLTQHPGGPGESHVEADLIICVASLREVLRGHAASDAEARHLLTATRAIWESAGVRWDNALWRERTRVQVCLGNLRRALGAAVEG